MNPKPTTRAFKSPILVTKPFLPPLESFREGLEEIWNTRRLTNNGPLLQRFRDELKAQFETDNLCLFNNGTLALQIGLQAMGVRGEAITTPFTFVATTHALHWNKIRPVFCDIEPDTFTLDPTKVEELITPRTTAILAVHVFGRPCRLAELAGIARRHNLTLIYDSAHAFGVRVNRTPIGLFGDLSMFSFHATKMFHSIEGGLLVFKDPGLARTFDYLKNFGFENETQVTVPGTNAKMNEMQALMGSLHLQYLDRIVAKRKRLYQLYKERLAEVPGISFSPDPGPEVDCNYAYVPVQIDADSFGMDRDKLYEKLKGYNIFARRYFYPLLNRFACYRSVVVPKYMPVAERIADQILSLPLYFDLEDHEVEKICDILVNNCTN